MEKKLFEISDGHAVTSLKDYYRLAFFNKQANKQNLIL